MDDGGIRKEYFMLLIKELLNPMFGMFYQDEESHLIWFRDQVTSLSPSSSSTPSPSSLHPQATVHEDEDDTKHFHLSTVTDAVWTELTIHEAECHSMDWTD